MVRNLKVVRIIIFMILSIMSSPSLFAATIMEERSYEPIVISAGQLVGKMDVTDIDLIKLYAFSLASNSWQPIPFQIDEMVRTKVGMDKDSNNIYLEPDNNPAFDAEPNGVDELVLMARDLGDVAPVDNWPWDADAKNYKRLALEFEDPLNHLKAYAYLFLSGSLAIAADNPYDFAFDLANDQVNTKFYGIAFNPDHGLIKDIQVKSPWGTGADIIDTQKMRFEGSLNYGALFTYSPGYNNIDTATEQNTLHLLKPTGDDADYYYFKTTPDPRVRLIRQVKESIMVFGEPIRDFSFYFKTKFYPYSGEVGINVLLDAEALAEEYSQTYDFEMDMARISLDYNANAAGMLFNNAYNTNIPIDGTMDQVDQTINTESIITTWALVSGTQGSVFTYFSIADKSWKDIFLYYYDNLSGGNADGSIITTGEHEDDTGDGVSYADNGLLVRNSGSKNLNLKFDMKFFFLPSSFSRENALTLVEQIEHPLTLIVTSQSYTVSVDKEPSALPNEFRLFPNYPNPFNSQTVFAFQNSKEQNIQLIIFDSQGKEIIRLADQAFSAGYHTIHWEGVDTQGDVVPTGIYLYRLSTGNRTFDGKLMFLK